MHMQALSKAYQRAIALGVAILLVAAGAIAFVPREADALTAGQIASAQPISNVLGQTWSPTWNKCYSTAKGQVILRTAHDQDSDIREFQAALDRAFTKGVKTLTSTNDNITSHGLKAGKTYYIRFRNYGDTINGYSTVGGVACPSWYSNWSAVKVVKVCNSPKKKNKLVGKWKLVTANFNKSTIKRNNRLGGKFILTLKKNGKGLMKDYTGTKYKVTSWGITSKKVGKLSLSGAIASSISDYGSAKVSGKRLVLKMKAASGKTYTMSFKKM